VAARALGVPALWHLWGPVGPVETESGLDFFRDFLPAELARRGLRTNDPLAEGVIDPCPAAMSPAAGVRRLPVRYVPYNGPAVFPAWLSEPPARRRVCVAWGTSITPIFGRRSYLVPRVLQALADENVEIVVAVSAADRGCLGELPPSVRFAGHVPLSLLLPTCAGIVHHGGAGSLMTAVAAGVPQVSLTFAPEQDAEGRRLAATGAGRHLLGRQASVADIGAAVGAILHDPAHHDAARRLRDDNLARPTPGELVSRLAELAPARTQTRRQYHGPA
jgi:UDP:flavonoid glycosyltransferase YjiC (YdhE family)